MTKAAENTFAPYQDIESRQLLWEYLVKPQEFYIHHARYANSVISA